MNDISIVLAFLLAWNAILTIAILAISNNLIRMIQEIDKHYDSQIKELTKLQVETAVKLLEIIKK